MVDLKKIFCFLLLSISISGCGGGEAPAESTAAEQEGDVAPVATEEPAEEMSESAANAMVYNIGSEPSQSRTFVIDSEDSAAFYFADEEFFEDALSKYNIQPGESDVVGRTEEVSGELTLDFGNPDLLVSGSFVVNLVSLETDQVLRDRYIRNNFLESNKYPEAVFTATGVEDMPETYTEGETISFGLVGDLSIRDVVKTVTFDVEAMLQDGRLAGVAHLPTTLTTFGIEPPNFANTLKVADEIEIEVRFTAVEQ